MSKPSTLAIVVRVMLNATAMVIALTGVYLVPHKPGWWFALGFAVCGNLIECADIARGRW